MSAGDGGAILADLDNALPLRVDPAFLAGNLAAMRTIDPRLASAIEGAELPPSWRAVVGLDGAPNYRIEAPGAAPRWLGETAAPATRAAALLVAANLVDKNVALPADATCADLNLLLDRLGMHQAVYWFAPGIQAARATLALADFATAIESRRLLVFVDDEFESELNALLLEHPGLLPPATIVNLPSAPAEQIERIRRQCDAAGRQGLARRDERLNQLRTTIATVDPGEPIRVACVALGAEKRLHQAASEIAAAAQRLGFAAESFALDAPTRAHPLALAEMIGRLRPTRVLRLDADARPLPIVPPSIRALRFCADPLDLPLRESGETLLAATPRVRVALAQAGFDESNIFSFFWACDSNTPAAGDVQRAIAIVADLPDSSAVACGIEQATHRSLWERLEQIVTARRGTADAAHPANLLRLAEGELGISLKEPELRTRLLRLIQHVLVPAIVLRRVRAAIEARFAECVICIGRGWSAATPAMTYTSLRDAFHAGVAPQTAIATVLPGGLTPELVSAAAAGWPILLHRPPGHDLASWVGDVFARGRHVMEFGDERELLRVLDRLMVEPERFAAMGAVARGHLLAHHSWDARLRQFFAGGSALGG